MDGGRGGWLGRTTSLGLALWLAHAAFEAPTPPAPSGESFAARRKEGALPRPRGPKLPDKLPA